MPDDPEQQATPSPLTTAAQLSGLARETLRADTGTMRVAGLVREALVVGIGLAGRIAAKSYVQGSVTTISAGLVLQGRIAATSKARASVTLALALGGRIKTTSNATSWFPVAVTVGGRIATMSRGRLLQRNSILVAASATAQSKARGLMYLQVGAYRAQWSVTVNTG